MDETGLTLEEVLLLKLDTQEKIIGLQNPDEVDLVSACSSFLFVDGKFTECRASVTSLTALGKERVEKILENAQLEKEILEFLSTGTHNLATITSQIGGPYAEKHIAFVLDRLIQEEKIVGLDFGGGFFTIKETI